MEARTAATPSDALARPAEAEAVEPVAFAGRGVATASRRGPVARPKAMSRELEYAFIRSDMNRLMVIAGVLLVAMIALLFVID